MPIKKENNEPVIASMNTMAKAEFLPSGIPELDEAVGGLPLGRITEVWGENAVGKSYTITKMMAAVSQAGGKVLVVDSEFALNSERVSALGANLDNIDFIQDARLERVSELLIASIGKYQLIILDSLAYLTPTTVDEQEVGENAIGLFSRVVKHFVIKFRPRLGTSKTAFVAVNQFRKPFGMFAKAEPVGGTSWLHAVDVRIRLTSNSADKIMKGKDQVGHYIQFNVTKSKVSKPFVTGKYRVDY